MQPPLFHLLFGYPLSPLPGWTVGRHISKVPNETRVSCSAAISISFLFRFYYFPLFSLKLSSGFPQLFPLFSLGVPLEVAFFDTCDIFMGSNLSLMTHHLRDVQKWSEISLLSDCTKLDLRQFSHTLA